MRANICAFSAPQKAINSSEEEEEECNPNTPNNKQVAFRKETACALLISTLISPK